MINNRKDVLLMVMHGIHRPVGRMRLVKMLYLFGEEKQPTLKLGIDPYYSFEATGHGAFSHRIYDDLSRSRKARPKPAPAPVPEMDMT